MFPDASPKLNDSDNNLLFKIAQILAAGGGGGGGGVLSFNTRTGAVTLTTGDVTTALGFTPAVAGSGVLSFNTRTGAVTLTAGDVSTVADSLYVLKDGDGTALIGGAAAPTALTSGAVVGDGTAPSADPAAASTIFSESGELKYRSSTASEGAGQNNRVHNRSERVAGAGTSYTLTTALANVVLGTTSPVIILPTAGVYFIFCALGYQADAAGARDVIQGLLRDVTNSVNVSSSAAFEGAVTSGFESTTWSGLITVTGSTTLRLQAINATAARGVISATGTNISYIRLS